MRALSHRSVPLKHVSVFPYKVGSIWKHKETGDLIMLVLLSKVHRNGQWQEELLISYRAFNMEMVFPVENYSLLQSEFKATFDLRSS